MLVVLPTGANTSAGAGANTSSSDDSANSHDAAANSTADADVGSAVGDGSDTDNASGDNDDIFMVVVIGVVVGLIVLVAVVVKRCKSKSTGDEAPGVDGVDSTRSGMGMGTGTGSVAGHGTRRARGQSRAKSSKDKANTAAAHHVVNVAFSPAEAGGARLFGAPGVGEDQESYAEINQANYDEIDQANYDEIDQPAPLGTGQSDAGTYSGGYNMMQPAGTRIDPTATTHDVMINSNGAYDTDFAQFGDTEDGSYGVVRTRPADQGGGSDADLDDTYGTTGTNEGNEQGAGPEESYGVLQDFRGGKAPASGRSATLTSHHALSGAETYSFNQDLGGNAPSMPPTTDDATYDLGGPVPDASMPPPATVRKAKRILAKKLGREPTQAEVNKKAKALVKKAAKKTKAMAAGANGPDLGNTVSDVTYDELPESDAGAVLLATLVPTLSTLGGGGLCHAA